jgi:hypothetical protein
MILISVAAALLALEAHASALELRRVAMEILPRYHRHPLSRLQRLQPRRVRLLIVVNSPPGRTEQLSISQTRTMSTLVVS